MSPSDFKPVCARCQQKLECAPSSPLRLIGGPVYCQPCAELIMSAKRAESAALLEPGHAPLEPKHLDAALARLDYLDRAATAPPWHRNFGYNNGGVATSFLKVPGHSGGAEVEMIAEDAELVALSRAALRLMLDTLAEARPKIASLESELAKVRTERGHLIAEASRLRAIAVVASPNALLIEQTVRDDGTPVVVLCAPDPETEIALAELMFAALAEVGVRIAPGTRLERTGVTAIDQATDLIVQVIEEDRKEP